MKKDFNTNTGKSEMHKKMYSENLNRIDLFEYLGM
jgi:hypothetical protein